MESKGDQRNKMARAVTGILPSRNIRRHTRRIRQIHWISYVLLAVSPAWAVPAWAQPASAQPTKAPAQKIPDKPSAPPALVIQQPKDPFQCERYFIYQGMRISCDSSIRQDAERLRPIIEDTPPAVSELDQYQANRRNIRTAAYVGTIGLAIMALGFVASRQWTQDNGELNSKGQLVRNLTFYGGLGLTFGTVVYGISILQTNEAHLGNAVKLHNDAHPDRPIELQFTTGISF